MFYNLKAGKQFPVDIDQIVDSIGRYEGFREKKYKDTLGIWTIGYGFNLESGTFPKDKVERWKEFGITKEEADGILKDHVSKILNLLQKSQPWIFNLTPARFMVMVDLTFNMGIGWFNKFPNMISFIKGGRYSSAASALMNSRYAKQVKNRAIGNAYAILNDTYAVPYTEKKLTI